MKPLCDARIRAPSQPATCARSDRAWLSLPTSFPVKCGLGALVAPVKVKVRVRSVKPAATRSANATKQYWWLDKSLALAQPSERATGLQNAVGSMQIERFPGDAVFTVKGEM